MKEILVFCTLLVCYWSYVDALGLPGPRVYVVTPASKPKIDEGRSAPFYYHNWIRRMDPLQNASTAATTTTTQKTKTPDLIFAEFESDGNNNMKSIRKLLEKERVEPSTTSTTTSRPIYVPDDTDNMAYRVNYGLPVSTVSTEDGKKADMTDYFALYNNMYGSDNHLPAPVYAPQPQSTVPSTPATSSTTAAPTTPPTTTTPAPMNVQNIWHIIDSEKYDKYAGKWEEESVPEDNSVALGDKQQIATEDNRNNDDASIDENFALPGYGTIPGSGAENESRAIRTEPNIRFPYINLKPFQMKKPLLNNKINHLFTSLDNFHDLKNPVRGEAQDIGSMRQPIDRYNPAQPYLPPVYGSKSKLSSPDSLPGKAVANLVPPPLPPRPQLTADDFPAPTSYESFPPYAPLDSAPAAPARPPPAPAPAPKPSPPLYQPPVSSPDDSDSTSGDTDGPPDVGYRYRPPAPPIQAFAPTIPPSMKPFIGYSYDKPPMTVDSPPGMDMDEKPYHGYQYGKPDSPSLPSKPTSSYGHIDEHPQIHDHDYPHHHETDYPELIFDKPHHGPSDTKTKDDMKGTDIGMMPPPPPPSDMDSQEPPDDHGFPHDFPGDFKFHHDFDDHDHDHHYHHHTTTTTTTTETPRVNRYSYYYLGKKLYYLPLYFSVYFIVYVGALIIKAVLRHKIVYPNSWRPNDQTASFFSKRSVDSWDLSKENLHEITGRVTHALATAAEKYAKGKKAQ